MINNNKIKINIIAGIFFFLVQFFIILGNWNTDNYSVFVWFCNHTPVMFGLAFIFNKTQIVKGLINAGFLAQLVWTIDFLSKILFNTHIFNLTNYIFESPITIWILLTITIHMFTTNVALIITMKEKPQKISLFYSFIYIAFLYFLTLLTTIPEDNINWVFAIDSIVFYSHILYTIFWPITVFILVILPSHFIQYTLYKKLNKE
jgi:hypothetical protein